MSEKKLQICTIGYHIDREVFEDVALEFAETCEFWHYTADQKQRVAPSTPTVVFVNIDQPHHKSIARLYTWLCGLLDDFPDATFVLTSRGALAILMWVTQAFVGEKQPVTWVGLDNRKNISYVINQYAKARMVKDE